MDPARLAERLRLIVVTDETLARPRSVVEVVERALDAGAPCIQLRMKDAGAGEMLEAARPLRAMTRAAGALLFVNDRLDVALACEADGVHLGPQDLPVGPVHRAVGDRLLLGYSTDDPEDARRAEARGAAYLGCGAVYGTGTKDVGDEAIGPGRLDEVARAVRIPVVAIGGVAPERAPEIARTGAAGTAVVRAVMAASDPGEAVRRLLAPFRGR